MVYDEILADKVRNSLERLHPEEKRAFGGLAFMVHGKMCVSVNNRPDHIMMVRIDPKNQDEALKRKGAKVAVMRGRKMNGWIFLKKDAIGTENDLGYWITLAVNFNRESTK